MTESGPPPPEIGPPEGWDNFANNLGSDLAPLLALFGEQVTRQYLSESLSWLDCVLFAIAPLGIITAMVAAIQVAGEPWLRSLIGRAKESRGDVEAELMSSTSSDVCELWNGDSIVRFLGSPVLLHLIHVDTSSSNINIACTCNINDLGQANNTSKKAEPATCTCACAEDKAWIYTFHEAITLGLYTTKDQNNEPGVKLADHGEHGGQGLNSHANIDAYDDSDIEDLRSSRQNPPNLSLNVSVKPLDPRILVFLGTIGILLQAGVLVWAAYSQYSLKLRKNDLPPAPYGFPIYAVGTVVLALGMFGCAWVVESSTCEAIWEPSSPSTITTTTTTTTATAEHGSNYSVLWLQQGGQIVGDQRFGSWSRRVVFPENKITTSHKPTKPGESKSRMALVNTAITLTFIGFVCQFFGLRVLHSSVTLAQLGAILVMTLIRCFGHIQRENRNDINDPEQVEGHELDWLAKDLKQCETWEVITAAGLTDEEEGSLTFQQTVSSKYAISAVHVPSATDAAAAVDVMKIRARLARLSKDWELEIRTTVGILQNAIEMTMKEVFVNMKLSKDFKNEPTFEWVISVKTEFGNIQPGDPTHSKQSSEIKITLRREKDDNHNWRAWKIEASELEAVLCLWVSSLTNIDKIRAKLAQRRLKKIRLVGLATEGAQVDYKLWIHRGTTASQTALNYAEARYFGQVTGVFGRDNNTQLSSINPNSNVNSISTPPIEYLYADATGSLEIVCAQELYTSFLFQLLRKVEDVGGITTRRTDDDSSATLMSDSSTTSSNDSWSQFRLENSNLATITRIFEECGLVNTVEDAYLCIVPAFRSANKLPSPHAVYYEARKACTKLAKCGEWAKVIAIDAWLYTNSKKTQASRSKVTAITEEITSRLRRASEALVADFESDPDDDAIYVVWNLAYSLCCTITEASEDLATTLVNLYKICLKVKPSIHPDAVFRHTFQVASGLDVDIKCTTEIIRNLYHLRLPSISTYEIEKYLSDPKSLQATADADVSGLDDDGQVPIDFRLARGYRTPLQMAAEIGHQAIVKRLLLAGADINGAAAAVDGRTALQAAAGGGHKEIVEILLAANADVNSQPELEGGGTGTRRGRTTALQAAAGGGYEEVVQILLDAGADCNAPAASNGWTALQAAAKGGHTEIVKLLLDCNADVNALPAEEGGQTAVRAAAIGGHTEVVSLLIGAKADLGSVQDKSSPLQGAAGGGHKEIVKLLLDAGADVNSTPPQSEDLNSLQSAASGGHKEIVQILLDAGADVNIDVQCNSRTALWVAAEAGRKEVVEILLAAKADVNVIWTLSGLSALAAAAGGGHQETVQTLLDAGADINAEAEDGGTTALKMAAGAGHQKVVEMLLAANADVNIPANGSGRTALQAAAEGGYHEVVELLLEFKPDLNALSVYGRETALQAAAAGGHEEVVGLLLDAGVDANIVTADGERNALQLAAEGGHKGVVKLLLDARVDLNPISTDEANTPLQAAAYGGHDEVVKMLLEGGANVNGEREGRKALEIAAAEGHLEVVKLLLKAKATINALSKHDRLERTALQAAVAGGHTNMVKLLLQAKANVNAAAAHMGRTALQEAVECRDKEMIHLLLAAKADIEGKPGEYGGRTALQTAAWGGQKELVEILLAAKADVNAPPAVNQGRTALQAATEGGHKEVVELLLAAKADVNAAGADRKGLTAIQAAAQQGHKEIVELLLAANADIHAPAIGSKGPTALQAAGEGGHKEVVELLLAAKADVNAPPSADFGRTALQAACEKGHMQVVELLLAAKADPNAPASAFYGRTALQAACEKGHMQVAELLLATKADPNAPSSGFYGRTALQAACEKGHMQVVELLLAAKADPNAPTSEVFGRTALQAACEMGYMQVVELLLAEKADVHAPAVGKGGRTALQVASGRGHTVIVKLLLAANADVNAQPTPYFGRTALQAAAEGGHQEVVELLLDAGANIEAPPAEHLGRTALQYAEDGQHHDVVNLIQATRYKNFRPEVEARAGVSVRDYESQEETVLKKYPEKKEGNRVQGAKDEG